MSETAPTLSPEKAPDFSQLKGPEHYAEQAATAPEQQVEHLESARRAVQELAPAKEHLALPVDDKPEDNRPLFIDRTVKNLQLKQTMKQVRSQLPRTSRALSKVVHQPLVKAVSDTGAKTVTRPSGLLGGGFFAFIGSLAYLFMASHVGFRYNYTVFLLFFLGGFVLGLLLELVVRLVRPRTQQ